MECFRGCGPVLMYDVSGMEKVDQTAQVWHELFPEASTVLGISQLLFSRLSSASYRCARAVRKQIHFNLGGLWCLSPRLALSELTPSTREPQHGAKSVLISAISCGLRARFGLRAWNGGEWRAVYSRAATMLRHSHHNNNDPLV